MVSPTRRPARAASALAAVAALGLASAWAGTASAQNTFNPYLPYNADLYNFIVPTQPVNLALPGAAREAAAFNSVPGGGGISRFNSFDRWLDDYESDMSRGRRGGPGGSAALDRNDPNRYIPNREADRGFFEREDRRDSRLVEAETTRARIARERDRYYAAAVRERDPARRAAYLKVVSALANPKSAESMLRDIDEAEAERRRPAQERRPAEDRRPAASDSGPFSRSVLRNPALGPASAAPANPGPKPGATAPAPATGAASNAGRAAGPVTASPSAAPSRPAATTPGRGTSIKLPDTLPPMPGEERKPTTPARPAPAPAPNASDLPAPVPLPDTAPPPPR